MYDEYMASLEGPEYIVVEIRDELLNAYSLIRQMTNRDVDMNREMRCLVDHLHDGYRIGSSLRAYYTNVAHERHCFFGHPLDAERDAELLVEAMKHIAVGLTRNMVRNKIYDKDAFLNYRFQGWVNPFTILLVKAIPTDGIDSGNAF